MNKTHVFMLFLAGATLALPGCNKDNSDELKAKEDKLLQEYIAANNITVAPQSSGLYFIETDTGTGPRPVMDNLVIMNYRLSYIYGTNTTKVVATSDSVTAKNNSIYDESNLYGPTKVIISDYPYEKGFMEGLMMMHEGSKATLIVPSDIAYQGLGMSWLGVPAYSTLIYDVELSKVITNPDAYEREQIAAYLDTTSVSIADSTEKGIYHIVDKEGSGSLPSVGDILEVNYTLYLIDGRKLGSSSSAVSFILGSSNYIEGWNEANKLIKKGETCRIIIPWYRAYGADGYGIIPPYSTLLYKIERIL